MFSMPEDNMLVACANECFLLHRRVLAEFEKTVPVESERVGVESRVSRNEGGEPECGAFGDGGAVREAECFFGHVVGGYFWED